MTMLERIKDAFNLKVLLCDLDGTLIETRSGKTFPKDENDWKFKPRIKEAIQEYNPKYIFIITNQGGIEKGFVDKTRFEAKLRKITDEMSAWGNYIVHATYCASNDPDNVFRKPNIGMVDYFRYADDMGWGFTNRHALMIGDASGLSGQHSDSDLQCAKNAGIKYTDVKYFIEAMVPCLAVCGDNNYPCGAGLYPFLPCTGSKRERIKQVLLNK